MYREYSSGQGRWISPDPAGLAAVSLTNPQSWNRYAYVANNPLALTDPLGLYIDGNPPPPPDPIPTSLDPFSLYGLPGFGQRDYREDLLLAPDGGDLSGTPGFPISKECRDALGKRGVGGVQRAQANWSAIHDAASAHGIEPRILAAIGVRETNFKNIAGDFGHGHGVFQFDDRYNSASVIQNIAYDIPKAADLAAARIAGGTNKYLNQGYDYNNSTAAAIREYNGTGGISTSSLLDTGYPGYLNLGTTGNDYVRDVLAIAINCF